MFPRVPEGRELLDRCQIRIVLDDQRAFADEGRSDHAIDRRADRGIAQIEPRTRDIGLAAIDFRLCLAQRCRRILVLGFGDHLLACERRNPSRMLRSQIERRGRLGQRSLVGAQIDFERLLIDSIERIARLHFRSLVKHPVDNDAGYTRPNLGNAGRCDATGQFANQRARLRFDCDDADFRIDFCRGIC
jgi:hypothetical protein